MRAKNNNRTFRYIAFLGICYIFLVLGICLICSTPLIEAYMMRMAKVYSIEEYTAKEIYENLENSQNTTESMEELTTPDVKSVIENLSKIDKDNVIGGIYIPSVGIQLPVMNGITSANLIVGAGTVGENQRMGQGNYALAGHHMKDPDLLFGPLLSIEKGALIQLGDQDTIYTYKVEDIQRAHQSQVEVLEETSEATITLITCDVTGINTDFRHVVFGKLLDISKSNETNEYVKGYQNQFTRKRSVIGFIKDQRYRIYLDIFVILLVSLFLLILIVFTLNKKDYFTKLKK